MKYMENNMNGLELAKSYYEEIAKPLLVKEFPELIDKIAIGLVGHGSECFGFDDNISLDHDYEPGFCIWINEDINKEYGFKLFRFYQKLPSSYKGVKLQNKSVVGSNHLGVHTINEFYSFYLPEGKVPNTLLDWLKIDDFYLAEATNGVVFSDPSNEFSSIRNALNNRPNDIRLKKLASNLFYMAQYGQYNYQRCASHKQKLASFNCLSKFIEHTAYAIYLLNNKYAPYYKWLYKGLESLEILSDVSDDLLELTTNPYDIKNNSLIIEKICKKVIDEIKRQGLSTRDDSYLEGYCYDVNEKIKDVSLKLIPVML